MSDESSPEENEETENPSSEEDPHSFFRGIVSSVSYRNSESGFGILKAEPDPGMQDPQSPPGTLATVVGIISDTLDSGVNIIARGGWNTHPKFGRQFKARSLTESDPTGGEAIRRYLSSGAVKGFGPVLASRVVELFGDETLSVIDDTPQKLLSVPGIGQRKLEEIVEAWQQKRNLREVLLFFQKYGVSLGLAQRIYNAYGDRAIEIVSENPYVLSKEVWRVGFKTADKVAHALGTDPKSPERIIAGLAHAALTSADEGHCYLPKVELLKRTSRLLELSDHELLASSLAEACLRGDIIEDEDRLYLPQLYSAEQTLARCIVSRIAGGTSPEKQISQATVDAVCFQSHLSNAKEGEKVITLSEQQKKAISLAASEQLLVITGGPGCGKTTVLKTVAALFRRAGLQIKLTAPTGRAAQRLSEVCEMPASTIHRLLKFDPHRRTFVHDQSDTLPLDVLIIDESSMIDLPLAASLLKAVPPRARVIIVGDSDQLPSVGPGLFLSDLLEMEEIPRVRLTELFRRADESRITHIAHDINQGTVPSIPQPDGSIKTDAYFLPAKHIEEASNLIERLVVEQIPKKFGLKHSDITVLSPMNQGDLGIIALNHRLQNKLVPKKPGLPWVAVNNLEFRLGDRVCQRVNNYQLHPNGVFNGDQGIVTGIDKEARSVFVQLWDGREIEYPSDTLSQLDLAYALTIHRSQGSEVPAVILALHETHNIMLERQLIYTGITRAKQLLVIVGTKKALAIATKRSRSTKRNSNLQQRIRLLFDA